MLEALDPGALKRLHGHINFWANKKKTGNIEKDTKIDEAKDAQQAWENMVTEEKHDFLRTFEEAGGAKGKDALKLSIGYYHKVEAVKRVECVLQENLVTRRAHAFALSIIITIIKKRRLLRRSSSCLFAYINRRS